MNSNCYYDDSDFFLFFFTDFEKGTVAGNKTDNDVEIPISIVEEVQGILDQIQTYSVKELRELIAFHTKKSENENGKSCGDSIFLEKDDMRKKLKEILLSSLTEEELMSLNNGRNDKTI